jgi:ADP-heptose:LPS heptosyltransferase
MGPSFGTLPAGQWIMGDTNAFEIALSAERGTATMDQFTNIYDKSVGQEALIIRSGAIGDLLLLTTALRALKQSSNKRVILCCFEKHHSIFKDNDSVDSLISYPLLADAIIGGDKKKHLIWRPQTFQGHIFSLENVIELATDVHATDAFAKALGVTVTDYKPIYIVSDQEKKDALAWKKEFGTRPLVGIQMRASTRNRDYPAQQWAKVILGLEDVGWAVILFGQPGQIPPLPPELQRPFIHDASQSDMSLRESVSILSVCDAFVGVDSAFLHFCHALDVPAVGLFAAFDWRTRTSKAPLTRAISGHGECAPCSWLGKLGQHFPPMPCRQRQICSVLASIEPDKIIAAVEKIRT